jgi:Na+-transporting NADH:ubiquinone oxidoreductase subunit C
MIREKPWFPVLYMFVVTAAFSTVVIGLTRLTSERVEANERLAFEKAVLSVLPDVDQQQMSRLGLHRQFEDSIEEPDAASGGAYTALENGQIAAYVLSFSGQGFWAPIKGVIGIKPDKTTVTGIAFYEQKETPGLGAEITKQPFKSQFQDKEISSEGKPLAMKRPGETLGRSEFHAVTGATQTSVRVERIINSALKEWQDKMAGKSREGGQ